MRQGIGERGPEARGQRALVECLPSNTVRLPSLEARRAAPPPARFRNVCCKTVECSCNRNSPRKRPTGRRGTPKICRQESEAGMHTGIGTYRKSRRRGQPGRGRRGSSRLRERPSCRNPCHSSCCRPWTLRGRWLRRAGLARVVSALHTKRSGKAATMAGGREPGSPQNFEGRNPILCNNQVDFSQRRIPHLSDGPPAGCAGWPSCRCHSECRRLSS